MKIAFQPKRQPITKRIIVTRFDSSVVCFTIGLSLVGCSAETVPADNPSSIASFSENRTIEPYTCFVGTQEWQFESVDSSGYARYRLCCTVLTGLGVQVDNYKTDAVRFSERKGTLL